MRNQLLETKEFYIISRSIDNASKCNVIEICEDCFKVQLDKNARYEKDESVELFAMTEKGQLYFETIIKEVEDNILSVWFPITYKYLQRREYSRIQTDKNITLKNDEQEIESKIIDISAGGLKLTTNIQLELLKDYKIEFDIENKKIECYFEPIRTEAIQNRFISSGAFKNITSYDRIAIVQYCFKKQIENNI